MIKINIVKTKIEVRELQQFFLIPASLLGKRGNSAENGAGKFKIQNINVILNFSTLDLLVHKIKDREY